MKVAFYYLKILMKTRYFPKHTVECAQIFNATNCLLLPKTDSKNYRLQYCATVDGFSIIFCTFAPDLNDH